MKIYTYLSSGISKDVLLGMVNIAHNSYCSEDVILEDINKGVFNYGDIFVVHNSGILNIDLKHKLCKLGVALRQFKGEDTNLVSITVYDKFLRDYIDKVKLGDSTNLYQEAEKSGISYGNLYYYTKKGKLLEQCNKALYDEFHSLKNNNVNTTKDACTGKINSNNNKLLSDIRSLCIQYGMTLADIACLCVKNIGQDVGDTITREHTSTMNNSKFECEAIGSRSKATDEECLRVLRVYVNDTTGKSLTHVSNELGVNDSSVKYFTLVKLEYMDGELHAKYKEKTSGILNGVVSSRGISDDDKIKLLQTYIDSKDGKSLKSICKDMSISTATIHRFISTKLKNEYNDIYLKYKQKILSNSFN